MADEKKAEDTKPRPDKSAAEQGKPKEGKAKEGKPKEGKGEARAEAKSAAPEKPAPPARLKVIYKNEIAPALTKQFGYKSPMQVPRLSKIVLNMGVGEATGDKKILDNAVGDMTKISGQKPVITKAR